MAFRLLPVWSPSAASYPDRPCFRLFLSSHWTAANCATRQFPQSTLPALQSTATHRKTSAQDFISSLDIGDIDMSKARYVDSFPPLVHVFTHLKLTMHAYRYKITADKAEDVGVGCNGPVARKWVDTETMDDETLSTGMRKCWELVAKTL